MKMVVKVNRADISTKFFLGMLESSGENIRLVERLTGSGMSRHKLAKLVSEDPESGIVSKDTAITKIRDLLDERKKPDQKIVNCLKKILIDSNLKLRKP